MDEQLLKDFLETAKHYNYNWDVIMPKFPELDGVDLQTLKDYAETAKHYNYNYSVINPKFPELFSDGVVKKKEDGILEEVATATLQEETTSSEPARLEDRVSQWMPAPTKEEVQSQIEQEDVLGQQAQEELVSQDERADIPDAEDEKWADYRATEARKRVIDTHRKRYEEGVRLMKKSDENMTRAYGERYKFTEAEKRDLSFFLTHNEDPELEEIRDDIKQGYVVPRDKKYQEAQKKQLEEDERKANIGHTRNVQSYLNARTEEELEDYLLTNNEGVKEIKRERWREHQEKMATSQVDINRARDKANQSILSSITPGLIGMEEEFVVSKLNIELSKYGFKFEETGGGDAMIVTSSKSGVEPITIDLDPMFNVTEIKEANKLKKYLKENSLTPIDELEADEDLDYSRKALTAKNLRKVARVNNDGSHSTVLMESANYDNREVVYPTLFPKNPNDYSTRPEDWMELKGDAAYDEAKKRGELFFFDTEAEAQKFAEGDWKYNSSVEAEMEEFGKNFIYNGVPMPIDAQSALEAYEAYEEAKDLYYYIENNGLEGKAGQIVYDKVTDEFKRKYKDIYTFEKSLDGTEVARVRSDVKDFKDKTLEDEMQLLEQDAFDNVVLREFREKLDLHLTEKQALKAKEGAKANELAKEARNNAEKMASELSVEFENITGIPISRANELKDIDLTDEQKEKINDLIPKYDDLEEQIQISKAQSELSANQYLYSSTYFSKKFDKSMTRAYVDGVAGIYSEIAKGWNNGQVGDEILKMALGYTDIDDPEELRAAVTELAFQMAEAESYGQSAVVARANKAKTWGEWWSTIGEDPGSYMIGLAGSSMSQMLPYGWKIVGATTAAGAAIGGGVGATGLVTGPGGVLTTAGGFVIGGARGLQTGIAITSYALEYTNAVSDAARNKGYDLMNTDDAIAAFQDDEVWAEGFEIGTKRGIPIMVADFLGAGLAGKVFKVGTVSTKASRIGGQIAERLIFDPVMEGAGEAAAMIVSGQEFDLREVLNEAIGGFGNNAPNMVINLGIQAFKNDKVSKANNLTKISNMAKEGASDSRIVDWTNNMVRLGQIDADTGQRINTLVGIKRDAKKLLRDGGVVNFGSNRTKAETRVMELLDARAELTNNNELKTLATSKETVKKINEELSKIVESNGKLLPVEEQVDLGTVDVKAPARYVIKGKGYTKKAFVDKVKNMSEEKRAKTEIQVLNDPETARELGIKTIELDAVQEQQAKEGVLRPEEKESVQQVGLQEVGQNVQEKEVVDEVAAGVETEADKLENLLQEKEVTEVAPEEVVTEVIAEEGATTPAEVKEEVVAEAGATQEKAVEVVSLFNEAVKGYSKEENLTPNQKRSITAKATRASKKLNELLGFDIGALPSHTAEQKAIRDAIYAVKEGDKKSLDALEKLLQKEVTPAAEFEEEVAPEEVVTEVTPTAEVKEEVVAEEKATPAVITEEDVEAINDEITSKGVESVKNQAEEDSNLKKAAKKLGEEIRKNTKKYKEFIDDVSEANNDLNLFLYQAINDYARGKVNKIVEKYSDIKKIIKDIVLKFKRAIMIGVVLYSVDQAAPQLRNATISFFKENVENLGDYAERYAVKQGLIEVEEMSAPEVVVEVVAPVIDTTTTDTVPTVTLPASGQHFIIKEKRDGKGVLSVHSNFFNNSDGFNYSPVPKKGNKGAPREINGDAVAHFFILDERPDDFKDIYDADQAELQRQSEWFRNRREWKSGLDTDYYPVFTKLDNGQINVKYKAKGEIDSNEIVIQKLVQHKAGDIDFKKEQKPGLQYRGKKGTKLYKEYPNYRVLTIKSTGKGLQSVIFKKDTAGRDKYSKFSGAAGVFIAEAVDGQRYVKDFAGSVNNMISGLEDFAKITGVKEDDITIAFYDAGSVTAKPTGNNGKLNRRDWSGYNNKDKSGSGLAFPPRTLPTIKTEARFKTKTLLAPNGKPSNLNEVQHKTVRTPEFKRWFGDWENDPENASKVLDENGEPLVMYHGTDVLSKELIYEQGFKSSKDPDFKGTLGSSNSSYFISFGSKESASHYDKGALIPVFINMRGEVKENFELRERIAIENGLFWTRENFPREIRAAINSGIMKAEGPYKIGAPAFLHPDVMREFHRLKSESNSGVFVGYEAMVPNPNQAKLADGTNRTFDPTSRDIRFKIIGENADLSHQVRVNLYHARMMEKNNKSPLEIRIDTGWERGADGKWKYEISPSKLRTKTSAYSEIKSLISRASKKDLTLSKEYKLSDLIENKELFDAYPKKTKNEHYIGDLKVIIDVSRGNYDNGIEAAFQGPSKKSYKVVNEINVDSKARRKGKESVITVYINPDYWYSLGQEVRDFELLQSMSHETQHYIQSVKEDFQGGSSPKIIEGQLLLSLQNLYQRQKQIQKASISRILFSQNVNKISKDVRNKLIAKIKDVYKDALSFNLDAEELNSKLATLMHEASRDGKLVLGTIRGLFGKLISIQQRIDSYEAQGGSHRAYESYFNSAGEAEARNVEKRLLMTPEERRKTLLEETEDVAREDQLLFFNYETIKDAYPIRSVVDPQAKPDEIIMSYGVDMSGASKIVDRFNKAFPNVKVFIDQDSWSNVLSQEGLTLYADGAYGVTVEGDVYLNPSVHTSTSEVYNTLIHEMGHVWTSYLQATEKGKSIYKKGASLIKEGVKSDRKLRAIYNAQLKKFNGNEAKAIEEVMAILIGNKGEIIVNKSIREKFQNWLSSLWDYVKTTFKMSQDLTADEIQNLTLEDFINTALADILSGKEIKLSEVQKSKMKNPGALFKGGISLTDIVSIGRENQMSDEAIRKVAKGRGFTQEEIDSAMEVSLTPFWFLNYDGDIISMVNYKGKKMNAPPAFSSTEGIDAAKKIYEDVKRALKSFIRKNPGEMAEVREELFGLVKTHPFYKKQSKKVQEELTLAFDRLLKTRANEVINDTLSRIRDDIKTRKIEAAEIKKTQADLIAVIKAGLSQQRIVNVVNRAGVSVKKKIKAIEGGFSNAQVLRWTKLINKSTKRSEFIANVDIAITEIESAIERNRQVKIKDIFKEAKRIAKKAGSRKVKAAGVDAATNQFYADVLGSQKGKSGVLTVINAEGKRVKREFPSLQSIQKDIEEGKSVYSSVIEKLKSILVNEGLLLDSVSMDELLVKQSEGKKLSLKEQSYINVLLGAEMFGNINDMSFQETAQLLEDVKQEKSEGIAKLKAKLLVRAAERAAIKAEADKQIASTFKALYNEYKAEISVEPDGSLSIEITVNKQKQTYTLDELSNKKDKNSFEKNVLESAEERKAFVDNELKGLTSSAKIATAISIEPISMKESVLLDKNEQVQRQRKIWAGFEKLNVWSGIKNWTNKYKLNTAGGLIRLFNSSKLVHLPALLNILDRVNQGKDFFKVNVQERLLNMRRNRLIGLENTKEKIDSIANSIPGIKNGFKGIKKKLKGVGIKFKTADGVEHLVSKSELLRIYALYQNEVQRNKLETNHAIGEVEIEKIKKILGKEVIEFADKIIEWLSGEYFESVNDVYSDVNNVNLNKIENYFPTKTITANVNQKLIVDGDFSSIFNAETAPALKNRTDTTGKIELYNNSGNLGFIETLENHIETMERYKAFAHGTKILNDIINKTPSVQALLNETALSQVIKYLINQNISPDTHFLSGANQRGKGFWNRLAAVDLGRRFTSMVLGWKIHQIPKQASSFITAYEKYTFLPNTPVPGLDTVMFLIDQLGTFAELPLDLIGKGPISTGLMTSPEFRERWRKGLEGDVWGLESGAVKYKSLNKTSNKFKQAVKWLDNAERVAGGMPTVIGDVSGVSGYLTAYRRNIINGMSEEQALKNFEAYESTQQPRGKMFKIPLQSSKSALLRAFTMFGSAPFMMINKVLMSGLNINRSTARFLSTGKKSDLPKAKDLRAFYLNYAAANVLFQIAGNIYKIMEADDDDLDEVWAEIEKAYTGLALIYKIPLFGAAIELAVNRANGEGWGQDSAVNPLGRVVGDVSRAIKKEDVEEVVKPIVGILLGKNLDPIMGTYNYFGSGSEEDYYDMMGIPKSQRPSKTEITPPKRYVGKETKPKGI